MERSTAPALRVARVAGQEERPRQGQVADGEMGGLVDREQEEVDVDPDLELDLGAALAVRGEVEAEADASQRDAERAHLDAGGAAQVEEVLLLDRVVARPDVEVEAADDPEVAGPDRHAAADVDLERSVVLEPEGSRQRGDAEEVE